MASVSIRDGRLLVDVEGLRRWWAFTVASTFRSHTGSVCPTPVIELRDERFDRLAVEVADPTGTVTTIERALDTLS